MFNHESCEFGAVNEDEACVDAFGIVARIGTETRRGDEHSTGGLSAMKRPDEGLNVWAADVAVGVALGLDVNNVESQRGPGG